jgi:hypothetical protein
MRHEKIEDQKEERWMIHDRIRQFGRCCDLATRRACVCLASVSCPKHGSICVGTHD